MVADLLTARIAASMAAATVRAQELRKAVPHLAHELERRGARRVILFGSLASGAQPHAGTDIDLCVEGLEQDAVERAEIDLASRTVPLHLVRWETAAPELRSVIEQYGVVVEGEDEPQ